MCRCHWLVTSRHQQSQPLGIIAGSLYLYGAAFHGAGMCAFGAAAYRITKIGQAEITLVIGARKPFRRDATNTLAPRHVEIGRSFWVRVINVMDHSHVAGLRRSAALQPCPSARPGVQGARAAGEGDHPACTSHGLDPGRESWGDRPGRAAAIPCAALGQRPKQTSSGKSAGVEGGPEVVGAI